jgi:hypothetical protein
MKSLSKVLLPTKTLHWASARQISFSRNEFAERFSIADKDPSHANKYLKSILDGNRNWVERQRQEDPEFFDKLAKPQTPKFLFFGCSDSRVPAVQILGMG